jgi:maltose alpha-D-glucosyltransferase/alpha-amylase
MALNVQGVDHSPEADAARRRVTERYLSEARQAFTQAYQAATATLAHDWQDANGQDAALTLFSLEKAAYEVAYEAENRPSWLPVPLQGLHGLLSGLTPESKTARGGETS